MKTAPWISPLPGLPLSRRGLPPSAARYWKWNWNFFLLLCVLPLALADELGVARSSLSDGLTVNSLLYTLQEFYTDAQYGPDFGYYYTGRILHDADDAADSKGAQESFNSYTTMPMALSPHFGAMLADRLYGMWRALGEPAPFFLFEFGGGTGVLARDILKRLKNARPRLWEALGGYLLGERSLALRRVQRQTAYEFVGGPNPKLHVVAADARDAAGSVRRHAKSLLADLLNASEIADFEGQTTARNIVGAIVSNELLDEMDPVKVRMYWLGDEVPSQEELSENCLSFRENYILQRVNGDQLRSMLSGNGPDSSTASEVANKLLDVLAWETSSLPCEMLLLSGLVASKKELEIAVEALRDRLARENPEKVNDLASGMCLPMLLAAASLAIPAALRGRPVDFESDQFLEAFLLEADRVDGSLLLTKTRYQDLRRHVGYGTEAESALLFRSSPAHIHTDELYLPLTPGRCSELSGWKIRHKSELHAAALLWNEIAAYRDGEKEELRHLKWTLRPGEAAFVDQADRILDRGFILSMDYGADFLGLAWLSIVRPNFEGLHIMDAREQLANECTTVSHLQCPGLQDITTSIDFTEVARSGEERGWATRAYGPLFLLESAFDPFQEEPLVHLLERAGGIRSMGVKGWYIKPEFEPWVSFKLLVQEKGGSEASSSFTSSPSAAANAKEAAATAATTTATETEATAAATTAKSQPSNLPFKTWFLPGATWDPVYTGSFLTSFTSCWSPDPTKPPLAQVVLSAASKAQASIPSPAPYFGEIWELIQATQQVSLQEGPSAYLDFREALLSAWPRQDYVDEQHVAQQQAYADMHLAMLLVDYWRYIFEAELPTIRVAAACGQSPSRGFAPPTWRRVVQSAVDSLRELSDARRIRAIYLPENYDRVILDLTERYHILGGVNASSTPQTSHWDPDSDGVLSGSNSDRNSNWNSNSNSDPSLHAAPAHVCLASQILWVHCQELQSSLSMANA